MKYSLALVALAATSAAAFAPSATGVREHVCHPTKREGKTHIASSGIGLYRRSGGTGPDEKDLGYSFRCPMRWFNLPSTLLE